MASSGKNPYIIKPSSIKINNKLDFNDVSAVKVKGDINITAIYGQNNVLLWSAT